MIGFGIEPLAAVSSDLVAAVVMKPIGGGIHFRRGTVHTGLVRWLMIGSVPGALFGSYAIAHLGDDVGDNIKVILGVRAADRGRGHDRALVHLAEPDRHPRGRGGAAGAGAPSRRRCSSGSSAESSWE